MKRRIEARDKFFCGFEKRYLFADALETAALGYLLGRGLGRTVSAIAIPGPRVNRETQIETPVENFRVGRARPPFTTFEPRR